VCGLVIILSVFVSAVASATYEKTCVLFSIGAMQTQVASVQDMKTDEGLKTAAKLFQVRTLASDVGIDWPITFPVISKGSVWSDPA